MQGQVPTIFAVHIIGTVMLDSIFDLHSLFIFSIGMFVVWVQIYPLARLLSAAGFTASPLMSSQD
jgi:hypothetical protein